MQEIYIGEGTRIPLVKYFVGSITELPLSNVHKIYHSDSVL